MKRMVIVLPFLTLVACSASKEAAPIAAPANETVAATTLTELPAGWQGAWKQESSGARDEVRFEKNQTIQFVMTRLVGEQDDARVPYPTACKFKHVGTIEKVTTAGSEERAPFRARKATEPTHVVHYRLDRAELIDAPAAYGAGCAEYVARLNKETPKPFVLSLAELDGGKTLYLPASGAALKRDQAE
jgi:hypothetical protein